MKAGVRHGPGNYTCAENAYRYQGAFCEGLMHGQGQLQGLRSAYTYEGEFREDRPCLLPNAIHLAVETFSKSLQQTS